jgi:hypothetical protein
MLLAVLALTGIAAPADAAVVSVSEAKRIADRWWGPHRCVGQIIVIADPTLTERGNVGEARGFHTGDCRIAILPRLPHYTRCMVILHEVGHLATGLADHTGPMSDIEMRRGASGCDRPTRTRRATGGTA